MTQEQRRQVYPFEMTGNFTQIPNAIFTHYRYYPKFDGNVVATYAYLLKNYNHEYGYAFPTQDQAELALNITAKSFRKYMRVLVDTELIVEPVKEAPYWNYVYRFNPPISSQDEFFRLFPEAKEAYDKRSEAQALAAPKREADKIALRNRWAGEVVENETTDDLRELSEWF